MLFRLILILIAIFAAISLQGCKKTTEPAGSEAAPQPKITQENLDSELDKLEKEIEADAASLFNKVCKWS